MPDFTYTGDKGRTYTRLRAPANAPEVGETYTLADDPGDGRWKPATAKRATHKKNEPASASEPVEPETPAESKES